MPIRLALPKENYDIAFPQGVTVTVRPLTMALYSAAQHAARNLLEAPELPSALLGLDLERDEDWQGAFRFAFLAELAARAFVAWQGVNDADDLEAACEPEAARLFIGMPGMAEVFAASYLPSYTALVTEGNASPPSPNGSLAGAGAATAKDAPSKTSPAAGGSRGKTGSSAPTAQTH